MAWKTFIQTAGAICLVIFSFSSSSTGDQGRNIQKYLRWNYTFFNEHCVNGDGGRNPCTDIRICNFAVASLAMGGWPTLCGWVANKVPKVCCGLPLVLGGPLMDKVNEEKARNRECGRLTHSVGLSETENTFFKILKSLPTVDTSHPEIFDPPLDLKMESMISSTVGRISRQGDFPWMVSILQNGYLLCAGSLIDRKHILSAAHCFVDEEGEDLDPQSYVIRIGNFKVDEGYPIGVKKIAIHDKYLRTELYHDIAMLTLEEEILIPQVPHICLPSFRIADMNLEGQNTTLLGWGETSPIDSETSELHIVDNIPVVSMEECRKAYQSLPSSFLPLGITDDFICAGLTQGSKDACESDSGGPLMYKDNSENLWDFHPDIPWVLVGVVSFSFRCGEPGFPGVYTRVSSHMDWILKHMNED